MTDYGSQIKNLVSRYLTECGLNKIAFFTNFIPSKNESIELAPYFSYICFCAFSRKEQSNILFNKYWSKFKRVPFDVVVSPIEKCIVSRQYNFISMKFDSNDRAKEVLLFIKTNKNRVNRKYPIIFRVIVESNDLCSSLRNNKYDVVCEISYSDVVIRVDK